MACAYTSSYSVSTLQAVCSIAHTTTACHGCSLHARIETLLTCSPSLDCVAAGIVRFSWRLLDWCATQLERIQVRSDLHKTMPAMLLRVCQSQSVTADGLPRYGLGCSGEERPLRQLSQCRMLYTSLLSKYVRERLRLQSTVRERMAGEPRNLAVLLGQSKLELCHPADVAIITL